MHTSTNLIRTSIALKEKLEFQTYKLQILTDEIRNQTTIGKSSGGELKVSFSIRPEVGLVKSGGVDVIVVAYIK